MRKYKFHSLSDKKIKSGMRFRDLVKLMNGKESGFIKAIVVNTMGISLLGLGIPVAVQMIINNIGVRTMAQPLVVLCLILFFILSCSGVLRVLQMLTIETLQRRLFVRYGLIIGERLNFYQERHFRSANSPDLINRYFDIIIMQSQMIIFFVNGFGFAIQFIIGFALLGFYHPYFLTFAAFMGQFLIVNWMLFGPDGVRAGSPEADGKYNLVSWIEELSRVRNIFTSDHGRDFSNKKLTSLFNNWLDVRNTLFNFQFRQSIGLQVFGVTMNVLLLGLGGYLVLNAELSAGQLVAAALVVNGIIASLPALQDFFFSVYNYSTALDMLARFYDYPLEEVKLGAKIPVKYDFELDNMIFEPNYHFKFGFKEGTKNLILVQSFSSISNLYDALIGASDHTAGYIRYNHDLIEDLDVGEIRNHIQKISRDQYFSGTIKENLVGLSGGKDFSLTELNDVLFRVGLNENIECLPDKLETILRPNGFPLSNSQLLALQMAKAILLKPRILIVTPDFEQISTYKRKMIYTELTNKEHKWTLLFFTQRNYVSDFDRYAAFSRTAMTELADHQEFLKEIEKHG
ncbi:MAG TPA: ABC transporter ATP-binding protein [Bacteriovoracaceae bacterium]|nr:ABC transporter ATP-binding protein [Bacteriovoracaceae bacterium]